MNDTMEVFIFKKAVSVRYLVYRCEVDETMEKVCWL